MASALSEALARKTNVETNKSTGLGMGPMADEPDGDEEMDPVEDAMSILFPDIDKAEAAAAFRRAVAACESEGTEE
jgi:hypothetical protein